MKDRFNRDHVLGKQGEPTWTRVGGKYGETPELAKEDHLDLIAPIVLVRLGSSYSIRKKVYC